MNKIYRRLWSTARQCWVVASELSATRGKSSQLVGAGVLALALTLSTPGAWAAEEDPVDEPEDIPVLDAWALQAAFGSRAAISGARGVPLADELAEPAIRQVALTTDHYYRDSTVDGDLLTVLGSRSTLSGSRSVAYGSVITSRGTNNTAIGYNVQITNGGYATAVGAESVASGVGTTVLGNNAKAYSENSIAVGSGANTVNNSAGVSRIAIGGNAYAGTAGWSGAVALGGNSRAEYDAVAVGHEARSTAEGALAMGRGAQATAANALAMGKGAKAQTASSLAVGRDAQTAATGSIAIGQGARITDAFAQDSIAIGRGANTQHLSSIALGSGSVTTGHWQVAVGSSSRKRRVVGVEDAYLARGSDHAVTGGQLYVTNENVTRAQRTADEAAAGARLVTQSSSSSAIRMGAENTGTVIDVANAGGTKRRIQNIANGVLSAGSTDAVTGQQLHATNQSVSTATSTANAAKASADAAVGRIGAAAVALGQAAVAEGSGSTASAALGSAAKAYNGNGVAMGADARAGVNDKGEKSTAATGAVAIGALSRSGNGAVATGLRASAIGDRAVALGNDANAAATHATAAGYKATASASQATAIGREASASGTFSTALGNLASARAESAVALGDRAVAAHTGSVALGNGSQTTAGNQISVGNGTLKRKIVNVADGALNTSSAEAVTGKQLNATNVEVASVRTTAASAQTTAGAAKTAADDALAKANALGGLVGQTSATGNVRLGGENTGTVLDVRNKSNASRKLTGVADATLSTSSTEAVSGKQLNATNVEVASVRTTATSAQTTANTAKTTADNALAKADVLGGLVGQVSATGNVRLGGENTGTMLDVRNKSNANRKLMGVADATLSASSTEAVSGKQLFGVDQKVTANQSLLASHATELAGHEARIAGNRRDLDDLRTEFDNFDPDLDGVVRYAADGSIDMDGGKVRGVAAGDISSAGSTDAVNGGQLFATNQRLSQVEETARYIAIGHDDESIDAKAGEFSVAIGDGAEAGEGTDGATAIGAFSRARGKGSVALGRASFVDSSAENGFALGIGSSVHSNEGVALGGFARIESGAEYSVALGASSTATEENVVSVGNLTRKRRIVNLARGRGPEDAVTVGQLGDSLTALGGGGGH
ncbi:ESPR-type extended signal peptide-containing protein [Stenotrophomonas sp. Ste96]|uniref:ESPR-type extended signal peptide-containing protein n=1 Tax=Stenotrophomonas sp. Ste96 TaxID=2926029 RepID=UPI0021C8C45B|nr:ESPR-type extended signal peptide-containing protein [Stenotrophomonas sp. Ste96]